MNREQRDRKQKTENRWQRTENRRQKTDGRKQMAENRAITNLIAALLLCSLPSAL